MSCSYIDTQNNPAVLISFGYSQETNLKTEILTLRDGQVILTRMAPEAFKAGYREANVPAAFAIRALDSFARSGHCDQQARRLLHFLIDGPVTKYTLANQCNRFRDWLMRVALARH